MDTCHGERAGGSAAGRTRGRYYHEAALVLGLDPAFPRFSSFLWQSHGASRWQGGLGLGGAPALLSWQ